MNKRDKEEFSEIVDSIRDAAIAGDTDGVLDGLDRLMELVDEE